VFSILPSRTIHDSPSKHETIVKFTVIFLRAQRPAQACPHLSAGDERVPKLPVLYFSFVDQSQVELLLTPRRPLLLTKMQEEPFFWLRHRARKSNSGTYPHLSKPSVLSSNFFLLWLCSSSISCRLVRSARRSFTLGASAALRSLIASLTRASDRASPSGELSSLAAIEAEVWEVFPATGGGCKIRPFLVSCVENYPKQTSTKRRAFGPPGIFCFIGGGRAIGPPLFARTPI
jgi:hypothetical protein